ncbi:MAG TPA: preprotein translocase subunit SecG [Firmicutes bacterium]|nr:preprotein translocase subunit SecG [Bacillota bacterium]
MFRLGIVDVLFMVVSIIIIILVALQSSKQGLSDSLTGGNSELFKNQKERGAEAYIVRATYICSIVFIILGIIVFMK